MGFASAVSSATCLFWSAVSSAAIPSCSGSAALTKPTPGKEKRKAAAGSFRSERRQWKARVRAPVGRRRRGERLHAEGWSVASGRRGNAREMTNHQIAPRAAATRAR
jgi:hypothetical protein